MQQLMSDFRCSQRLLRKVILLGQRRCVQFYKTLRRFNATYCFQIQGQLHHDGGPISFLRKVGTTTLYYISSWEVSLVEGVCYHGLTVISCVRGLLYSTWVTVQYVGYCTVRGLL
jgi:hypothetical protein